jgi:hypothetical protein
MPALRYDPALARAGSSFSWSPRFPRAAKTANVIHARRSIAKSARRNHANSGLETMRRTDNWCGPNRNNLPIVDCFPCI